MEGIQSLATIEQAAVEAIVCGHDVCIVSKDYQKIRASRDALAEAIKTFRITTSRVRDARIRLNRVLKFLI
jgi:hypothetical protein